MYNVIIKCLSHLFVILSVADTRSSNSSKFSVAVIGGLIGGIVTLIILIALMLAVIVYVRKLLRKKAHSVNPETYNSIHHSKYM